MKRYIDAELVPKLFDKEYKETRKLIKQGETHLDNLAEGFSEAARVIRTMPTADVVEVVRCKDCKFYKAYDTPVEDFDGFCTVNENEYDKDFFCQYGDRSEDTKRSRYIDADKLLKTLPDNLPYKASVKRVLIQAPTADVGEVVRCKDCIYHHKEKGGWCERHDFEFDVDDYCKHGERRKNDKD